MSTSDEVDIARINILIKLSLALSDMLHLWVGALDGVSLGEATGADDGTGLGLPVACVVGASVAADGLAVVAFVGLTVGLLVGKAAGIPVGAIVEGTAEIEDIVCIHH